MVFPSLIFQNDPGLISQGSGFVILAISFFLRRFKRIALIATSFIFATLIALRIYGGTILVFAAFLIYP